ncbi:TetR/AcrR family transcriptional regulator [Desulfovibrio sp. TomC]|uniref:TetR/AcrR family transcriptional regulator n=1 Tax=Desulfovibrio sp. TomC TaxID=1562888 RepID=UPI0005B80628|nr:TetR/AcrR family transcriptional regulator [Desulfovibrio sp. TomC]
MDVSRQVLVDTALRRFDAVGCDGVGTGDLVRRLGVSPGSVYRHFKNRDELLAAVLARVQAELFAHIEASCPVVPGERGLSMILRLAEAYSRFLESRPPAYSDIFSPPARAGSLARGEAGRELGRLAARVAKQFEVLLLLGRLDGSVRPEADGDTARRIVCVLVGTVRLRLTHVRARTRNLRAMLNALAGARAVTKAA